MIKQDQQETILSAIGRMGSNGRAESESQELFGRTFWPVPEHLRAFDPDVVLIVGPRGAGKTELFRAVIEKKLLSKITGIISGVRLPPLKQTAWFAGYSSRGKEFPSERQFQSYLSEKTPSGDDFLDIWLAYLLRALKTEIQNPALKALFVPPAGDVGKVIAEYKRLEKQALLELDSLDDRLDQVERYVFVAYDELDTLVSNNAGLTQQAVKGLVALWATHSRRWKRLRGKIFLRTDLYERAATAGGADFAKLAANRAEIIWNDRHLYSMLIRRLVNSDESLHKYCKENIIVKDMGEIGLFPAIGKVEDARPLIERMVGIYMGANERKGLTYRWMLDHIRDGRGQALPRPLVRLFEAAAELQKVSDNRPRWPRLLEPKVFRRALDRVSSEHVISAQDEWPWLENLKKYFTKLHEVPWDRREIERHLNQFWDNKSSSLFSVGSAHELVDYLVEVGIFRSRTDGRIDAPDLYLAGLGLKRKGGVGRK